VTSRCAPAFAAAAAAVSVAARMKRKDIVKDGDCLRRIMLMRQLGYRHNTARRTYGDLFHGPD